MLIISVHDRPVASMVEENQRFKLQYLKGVTALESISPNIPVRDEEYTFNALPEFLNSLLPDEETRVDIAKAFGFDQDDCYRLVIQALGTHNIGHIKVSRGVDGFDIEPFEAIGSTPRNPELVGSSLDVLNNVGNQEEMQQAIQRARGSVGIGGHFPKTVFRTREGRFLIKSYPTVEISDTKGSTVASMEAASLQAARYAGLQAPGAKAFGNLIAVQRFDKPGVKLHHLRDITNNSDKYKGSYEKLRDIVKEKAGLEAAKEFTKHVVFAWALKDSDKHQENCALLEEDGKFTLAPLYDSLPSAAVAASDQDLGIELGHRKQNHGWAEIKAFTDGYLTDEELKSFVARAVKGITQLVLPHAAHLKKTITKHLFYVNQVMEGKTTGLARKELAQILSKKGDPAERLSNVPLSEIPLDLEIDM